MSAAVAGAPGLGRWFGRLAPFFMGDTARHACVTAGGGLLSEQASHSPRSSSRPGGGGAEEPEGQEEEEEEEEEEEGEEGWERELRLWDRG